VAEFGMALDAALAEVEGKNKKELKTKTQRVLDKWLLGEVRFRDPATSGHVSKQKKG
jgi:hypothetical protein